MQHPYRERLCSPEEIEIEQRRCELNQRIHDTLSRHLEFGNFDFLPALEGNDSETAWELRRELMNQCRRFEPKEMDQLIDDLKEFRNKNHYWPSSSSTWTGMFKTNLQLKETLDRDDETLRTLARNVTELSSAAAVGFAEGLLSRAEIIDRLYVFLEEPVGYFQRASYPSAAPRPIESAKHVIRILEGRERNPIPQSPPSAKRQAGHEEITFLHQLEETLRVSELTTRLLTYADSPEILTMKIRLADRLIRNDDRLPERDRLISLARLLD